MASWKYALVRTFGNTYKREQTCSLIKKTVEERGLADKLPQVRFERGSKREYYLGLAVNDPNHFSDQVPEYVYEVFETANLMRGSVSLILVENNEVAGFLTGSVGCKEFTVPLSYEKRVINYQDDLDSFAATLSYQDINSGNQDHDLDVHGYANKWTQLLTWCSAIGSGDSSRLKTACQKLGIDIDDTKGGVWNVLRRLVLLGHLEFQWGNPARWAVLPPTLVQSLRQYNSFYLVGQRTEAILTRIREIAPAKLTPQASAPPTLTLESELKPDELTSGLKEKIPCLEIAGLAGTNLLNALPTKLDWLQMLPIWEETEFGNMEISYYSVKDDGWADVASRRPEQPGMYRFKIESISGRPYPTLVTAYIDEKLTIRTSDFYGARFLARSADNACGVYFHLNTNELVVRAADRFPMPYERALVLTSGLLPVGGTVNDTWCLRYSNVSNEFATLLCGKLGLQLRVIE